MGLERTIRMPITAIVVDDFTTVISGASTGTISIPTQGTSSGVCVPAQFYGVIPSFQSGVVSASGAILSVYGGVSGTVSANSGGMLIWQWTGSSQSGPAFQPPQFFPAIPITCASGIVVQCAAGLNMTVVWTTA